MSGVLLDTISLQQDMQSPRSNLLAGNGAYLFISSQPTDSDSVDSDEILLSHGEWTDVTSDVIGSGITIDRGMRGNGPKDRVASPGEMVYTLDNDNGTIGKYIPGSSDAAANFDVNTPARAFATHNGTRKALFTGYISSIKPSPGRFGERTTEVKAVDFMGILGKYSEIKLIAIQLDKTVDEVYKAIIDAVPRKPVKREITAPHGDTLSFALDASTRKGANAAGEIQKLAVSVGDYVFSRADGTFTYQPRNTRLDDTDLKLTLTASSDSAPTDGKIVRNALNKLDQVKTSVHPRTVGADSDALLWTLESSIFLGIGLPTKTIQVPYTDPTITNLVVGAQNIHIKDTDAYMLSTSADTTTNTRPDNLTYVVNAGATAAELVLTGTVGGAQKHYLHKLEVSGTTVKTEDAIITIARSSDADGNEELSLDMWYQGDATIGEDMAYSWLRRYESPRSVYNLLKYTGNKNDTLMLAAITADVGDKIAVVDSYLGMQENHFINNVHLEISGAGRVDVAYILQPSFEDDGWILDNSIMGTLGVRTILG